MVITWIVIDTTEDNIGHMLLVIRTILVCDGVQNPDIVSNSKEVSTIMMVHLAILNSR